MERLSHELAAKEAEVALDSFDRRQEIGDEDGDEELRVRSLIRRSRKGAAVNNEEGLLRKMAELQSDGLKWTETCDVTPAACEVVEDVNDDLRRDLVFMANTKLSVRRAMELCTEAELPFDRPDDFFAEMVKNDAHMRQIKAKLLMEQSKMKAVDARRAAQEHKQYAKQIQAEKLAAKAQRKKEAIAAADEFRRVKSLDTAGDGPAPMGRRKRKTPGDGSTPEARKQGPSKKRRVKDSKYGFGGPKKLKKQNDAKSSADTSGFSASRNRAMPPGVGRRGGGGAGGGRGGGGAGGSRPMSAGKGRKGKPNAGANRPGKAQRDKKRVQKRS
mmetsp:Transcript_18604/g.59228  ORF Transcript_18604/g.59228 Transcript_18604/m.59228 type:complete len:329 (-) Transcript_18604:246-1232(-)